MKGSRWFTVGILVFLLLMFAVEYRLPKKFIWTPTFSHTDKQPFGCSVFDELLSSSLPGGYSVSEQTFYQLEQEDTVSQRGILVIADNLHLSEAEADALLGMAKRGNKILLAASYFDRILRDRLEFESNYFDFNPEVLKKYVTFLSARDSLHWIGDPAVYPRQTFYFYPQLCHTYFWPVPLAMNRLAEKTARIDKSRYETEMDSTSSDTICQVSVAMSCPWGKGEILLVSTPLLFTNYGVLDRDNATYIFRLLSHIGGLPIVRTEAYMEKKVQMQASPFSYFLSQRPFRWALYLTMISVLLFMIFTARRRQRAIPVIREPENKSLEFTELIGTLYYQKQEHAILVRKKYTYFAEELRREIQVDVDEVANDERSFSRIAQKTGMDVSEISRLIREIRPVIYGGHAISVEQMKHYINKMNEIIDHI